MAKLRVLARHSGVVYSGKTRSAVREIHSFAEILRGSFLMPAPGAAEIYRDSRTLSLSQFMLDLHGVPFARLYGEAPGLHDVVTRWFVNEKYVLAQS